MHQGENHKEHDLIGKKQSPKGDSRGESRGNQFLLKFA